MQERKSGDFINHLVNGLKMSQPVLNGILGSFLADSNNGLAIQAGFYRQNKKLSAQTLTRETTNKICIWVHGLVCDETFWQFKPEGEEEKTSYGQLLRDDLQFTPFFYRYNSGLHISENGQLFADLLQDLFQASSANIQELILVGHSMGGLVCRSACYYGQKNNHSWLQALQKMILIGSPHLGAPLEKLGNIASNVLENIPVSYTKKIGTILNLRSKGIKDLRFGNVIDEDWQGTNEDALLQNTRIDIPLYSGAEYFVISGTISKNPENIFSNWFGDSLVRKGSALGKSSDGKDILLIQPDNHREFPAISHIGLCHSLEVYQQILTWCRSHSVDSNQQPVPSSISIEEDSTKLSRQELHGLTELVESAVAEGAQTVEEIQLHILHRPYRILEKILPIPGLIQQIKKLNIAGIAAGHKNIQFFNQEIARIAKDYIHKEEN